MTRVGRLPCLRNIAQSWRKAALLATWPIKRTPGSDRLALGSCGVYPLFDGSSVNRTAGQA